MSTPGVPLEYLEYPRRYLPFHSLAVVLWGVAFLCNWERSQIGLAWTFGVYALPKPLTCFALEYPGVPLTCPAARLPSCIGAALSGVAPIQRRRPAPVAFRRD